MSASTKFYLTTPIYYVNDKPHIGHAYTTIAADVLARFYRSRGRDVRFLTGLDEHGAKIAERAAAEELDPQVFVDRQAEVFLDVWRRYNVSNDSFVRTTSEHHKRAVGMFLQKLFDKGDVYEGFYEGLYCVGCEKFLTEKELVDGKCPDHLRVPERLKEKNYFFKLKKYLPQVTKAVSSGAIAIEPEARRNEILSLLSQGLEDFSLSRQSVKWGIPLPWDPTQVCYVWVEALQNYISDVGYGADDAGFQKWWPADLHLIGKEIIKFHAIFWPAMLLSAGLPLPKKIFANGFFTVDGRKMSKTLGNGIDPVELSEKFGSDAARYLLLSQFPFDEDGNIEKERFVEKYNADLANGLGNLVSRTTQMIEKFLYGRVEPLRDLVYDRPAIERRIQRLEFFEALQDIWAIIQQGNQYIDAQKPWEQAKNDAVAVKRTLGNLVTLLLDVAELLQPFLPDAGARIRKNLEQPIQKMTILFPRV